MHRLEAPRERRPSRQAIGAVLRLRDLSGLERVCDAVEQPRRNRTRGLQQDSLNRFQSTRAALPDEIGLLQRTLRRGSKLGRQLCALFHQVVIGGFPAGDLALIQRRHRLLRAL